MLGKNCVDQLPSTQRLGKGGDWRCSWGLNQISSDIIYPHGFPLTWDLRPGCTEPVKSQFLWVRSCFLYFNPTWFFLFKSPFCSGPISIFHAFNWCQVPSPIGFLSFFPDTIPQCFPGETSHLFRVKTPFFPGETAEIPTFLRRSPQFFRGGSQGSQGSQGSTQLRRRRGTSRAILPS